MNVFITSQIESVEKKMAGYHALLSYRYSNLCVKADPTSLLSVTLVMGSTEKDIEEVAEVAKPKDDYHLIVIPKMQDFIMDINQAVQVAHPEFKVEQKPAVTNDQKMTFAEFLSGKPEELKEANDQLNKSHDDYMAKIQSLLNLKRQEIEEGYQRYLIKHENDDAQTNGFDVTSSMKLFEE